MIQVNLLPKVKLDFIRARRAKRTATLLAIIIGSGSLGIFVFLFFAVNIVQTKYSNDLTKDIKSETQKINSIQDLNKILTIQNQLSSLSSLHDSKPVTSRVFSYIAKTTPDKVSISEIEINFEDNVLIITGGADSVRTVNTFADTLKFTTYKLTSGVEEKNAFVSVVLSNFDTNEDETTYELEATFDPAIFAINNDVEFIVPEGKITTRSEVEKPKDLFKPSADPSLGQEE